MRKIIFRGKRKDNGEWVHAGNIIHFNDEGIEQHYYIPKYNEACITTHDESDNIICVDKGTFYKVIPETVGQYTGLTDKNGTKIFEGDIVKIKDYSKGCALNYEQPTSNWVVKWNDKYAQFTIDYMALLPYKHFDESEVIGNIHDNPELLGGEE